MRIIALYGGSFNPIHNGHLQVAQAVITAHLADEVWLMVTPHNPLKSAHTLLDEQLRYRLAQRAVDSMPHVTACDYEFHLPRPSYTWDTLQALHCDYPDCRFVLLVGSDNWQVFHRWAHHDDLLHHYGLIVYPRPGYDIDATTLPATVHLLHAPLFPHSSTEIRQRIADGLDITPLVPPAIHDDILRAYSRS